MSVVDGGLSTGIAQKLATNYPFVAPSNDVRHLLADFWLAHSTQDYSLPFRISRLTRFCQPIGSCSSESSIAGLEENPQIIVVDADNKIIFDSASASYSGRSFSTRFFVHEWLTDVAVCRAVQHVGQHDVEDERIWPIEISPENGVLDERTHELTPKRVIAIRVNGQTVTGNIQIQAGYNVELEPGNPVALSGRFAQRTSLRNVTRVLTSIEPGLGEGRWPDCGGSESILRTINGVGPDDAGGLNIEASECLYVRRPSEIVDLENLQAAFLDATLKVGSDCLPCCECEDYVNVMAAIRRQAGYYTEIGDTAESVRDRYAEVRDRWLEQKECREENPVAMLLVSAEKDAMVILAAAVNTSSECKSMQLRIRIVPPATGDGTIRSVYVRDVVAEHWIGGSVSGTSLDFSAYWDAIDPSHIVKLRVVIDYVADSDCRNSATVEASAYLGGEQMPGAVTKSIDILCVDSDTWTIV